MMSGTVTTELRRSMMLCCLVRVLAPDAYATPLQRVELDSDSLRLPSGTFIEGERIEGAGYPRHGALPLRLAALVIGDRFARFARVRSGVK